MSLQQVNATNQVNATTQLPAEAQKFALMMAMLWGK